MNFKYVPLAPKRSWEGRPSKEKLVQEGQEDNKDDHLHKWRTDALGHQGCHNLEFFQAGRGQARVVSLRGPKDQREGSGQGDLATFHRHPSVGEAGGAIPRWRILRHGPAL